MNNKEHNNYLAEVTIDKRVKEILKWLEKNKFLMTSSDKVKVTINIKGSSIVGEITNYPET